ncbi:SAM-dependent methyltransferase, partial [Burkholderia sp. SIMBA_042]|uniref:SAM-dependent methyltransferase n=1 Tax=Burkholderia sp. SIMBA_042 TaxID=3085783 RepID=UPI00397940D7
RLVPEAKAKLIFAKEFNREEFVRGLDEFSHILLLFRFHETADKGYSAMVRPPRLGGNERKGVFATRATFRPNAIGMSAVK